MRVHFDNRPATDPRGIGRYTRCMLEALEETAGTNELVIGPRARGADVFHSPWIDGVRVRSPCAQVVTLHDLIPLKRRSEYLRTGIRFKLRYMAVERAAKIIVPTEAVAQDAIERLDVERDRLVVIPEAAAASMRPTSAAEVAGVRERYNLPEQYLLWVGGLEHPDPRKRVAALADTPRDMPLVLVGPTKAWAHELPDVTLTGHVSDDELAAIYTGARALVLASDDEGFGLPTVEALACGTPVVACDVPALREHLTGKATFVGHDDLRGLLAAAATAERPAPAAPTWTWQDAARATWEVYGEAVR